MPKDKTTYGNAQQLGLEKESGSVEASHTSYLDVALKDLHGIRARLNTVRFRLQWVLDRCRPPPPSEEQDETIPDPSDDTYSGQFRVLQNQLNQELHDLENLLNDLEEFA